MDTKHKWSGWPGAFCLVCGTPDPLEEALLCEGSIGGCKIPGGPEDPDQEIRLCPGHKLLAESGCPVSPDTTAQVNELLTTA